MGHLETGSMARGLWWRVGCARVSADMPGPRLGGLILGVDAQKLADAGDAIRELHAWDEGQFRLLGGPQRLLQEFLRCPGPLTCAMVETLYLACGFCYTW